MKYSFRILGLIAAASIVFFSCEKETALDVAEEVPETTDPATEENTTPEVNTEFDPSEYLLSFGSSFENDVQTKVDIAIGASDATLTFENGDKALAYNGTASAVYVYDSAESKFVPETDPVAFATGVQVYYPADEFTVVGSDVIFTMPAAITDVDDLGAKNPLAGKIAGSAGSWSVTFKAVGSILQVGVTGARELNSLTLSNTALDLGEGAEFTIGWDEEDPTMATAGTSKLSMAITGLTQALSGTAATYYFLLPAGIAYGGLKVTAGLDSADQGGLTTFDIVRGNLTAVRNKVMTMSFYAGLFSGGDGLSEATAYVIANARDYKHISTYCADGYGTLTAADFLGAYYKQTADISFGKDAEHKADLSAYMIGADGTPFTGNYNGQSYDLKYFSISSDEVCAGLWRVTSGATLKNIKVLSATVTSTAGTVGSLVGRADDGLTLDSCISTATVTASGQTQVGGLVGLSNGGMTIKGCVNQGSVTGANYTGGLVGYINTTESSNIGKNSDEMPTYNRGTVNGGSAVGGIVGETTGNTTITDGTYNAGDVTGSGQNVGGLVGRQNKDGYVLTINGECSNGIPVIEMPASQITIKSTRGDASNACSHVGGLVGAVEKGTIVISENCFNRGNVTGSAMYAGGIVGRIMTADCTIRECVNYGNVETTGTKNNNNYTGGILGCSTDGKDMAIISCTNEGEVTSTKTFVGGIAGRFYTGTIDLCVNAGNINGTAASANNVGGITGGIFTATVKRCYSAKGKTVQGGTRVGGIVGIIEQGGKVISCASYSFIKGKYTKAGDALGVGCIVGVEQNESALIANCVALYDDANTENHYSLSSGKSNDKKYTGGLVGAKVAGTLQNCYCKVPARWIGFVYNTSGNIVAGTTTNAANTPYMGQIAGRNTAGDVTDCYYGGFNNGRGAIAFGTNVAGTINNVTCITTATTTQYMHDTTIPVAVTTSTGTSFDANTFYLKDILDGGVSGISGYTPAEGEVLTWSNLSASDYTPIPTAILGLYTATEE